LSHSASSCDRFEGDDGVVLVVSNSPSSPSLLAIVIAVAATIGIGGATVTFCFSFFPSLFNLPFAFFLVFSLSL
jgi:hypothetical protein